MSGGSAMPEELMRQFEEAFGCIILEGYGLSETSPVASFNHPDRERKPGSIGTPIEGVDMKIVDDQGEDVTEGDVGEIVIRGHNIMKGYWNRPEETAAALRDGWLHTGDVARIDEEGYVYLLDRLKDMVITGGENVYSSEVEAVLYRHPAVAEAAVIGVPDAKLGETIMAVIVPKPGTTPTEDEIAQHCRQSLGGYKIPRRLAFVERLPRSAMGKVLKTSLRDTYGRA
jgi:long-chain acyl-CoA synthetase